MPPFSKPYLPVSAQIALLKSRGLAITDNTRATAALERIGYYRLSGYWYPMRASSGTGSALVVQDAFRPGSEFGQIIDLYVFDKKLRLLTLDAIERVEVALRTDIALLLGQHSPVAHREPDFLHGRFTKTLVRGKAVTGHQVWLARLDETTARSREEFVEHFRRTYSSPLPIWMAVELWDFGMLSHFLAGMRHQDQTTLAAKYGLPRPELLTGWIRSINFARNVCAHHARLWNRPLVDQPPLPRAGEVALLDHMAADPHLQKRFYAVAAILRYLLTYINPTSSWATRLTDLVDSLPAAPSGTWDSLPIGVICRSGRIPPSRERAHAPPHGIGAALSTVLRTPRHDRPRNLRPRLAHDGSIRLSDRRFGRPRGEAPAAAGGGEGASFGPWGTSIDTLSRGKYRQRYILLK